MPPHYRAHVDAARTERKIALGRLDRAELAAAYEQATGKQSPAQATEWELISGILAAVFPRVPKVDRRLGPRASPTNPTGCQVKREKSHDSRE